MERNIKTYRAHIALACLYGFVLATMVFFLAMSKDPAPGGWLILLFFLIPLLFHFFVAKGAKEMKSWARRASAVIGFLMLFGFPIGTIIGLYLISNAWNDWPSARPERAEVVSA
jgi:hypothetical protein